MNFIGLNTISRVFNISHVKMAYYSNLESSTSSHSDIRGANLWRFKTYMLLFIIIAKTYAIFTPYAINLTTSISSDRQQFPYD